MTADSENTVDPEDDDADWENIFDGPGRLDWKNEEDWEKAFGGIRVVDDDPVVDDPAAKERKSFNWRAAKWLHERCPSLNPFRIVDACTFLPEEFRYKYDRAPQREEVAAELLKAVAGKSRRRERESWSQCIFAVFDRAASSSDCSLQAPNHSFA
jgi:hypothetical protein